jgi:hypothetical protein
VRSVHKGSLRWEIRIGVLGPGEKMQKGWGDPRPRSETP